MFVIFVAILLYIAGNIENWVKPEKNRINWVKYGTIVNVYPESFNVRFQDNEVMSVSLMTMSYSSAQPAIGDVVEVTQTQIKGKGDFILVNNWKGGNHDPMARWRKERTR